MYDYFVQMLCVQYITVQYNIIQLITSTTEPIYILQTEITKLSNELTTAWNKGKRLECLDIISQMAVTLNDTSDLTFYPSKFVLITDELERFRELILSDERSERSGSVNWDRAVSSMKDPLKAIYVQVRTFFLCVCICVSV